MGFKGRCSMLMLQSVEWLRCELNCDQVVLVPTLVWWRGEKDPRCSFFSFPRKKKPDRGLGVNGFKKKQEGRE